MFDLLETAGANCRSILTQNQNTLLHWFCLTQTNDEHTNLLKRLIDQKCDLNAENSLQRTPLMLAAKFNMINTVRLLVQFGADTSKKDYYGERAIDLASINSQSWKFLQKELFRTDKRDHVIVGKLRSHPRDTSSRPNSQDFDVDDSHLKHKRVWEILLHTKDKIRRNKDAQLDFISNDTFVTIKL